MLEKVIIPYDNLEDLLISLSIFSIFLIFRKIFTKYVFRLILKASTGAPTELFSYLCLSFEKPLRWLFLVIGFYVSVGYFPFIDQADPTFLKVIRSSVIVIIAWGLYNLSSASSVVFTKMRELMNIEVDKILIPVISKAIRFIIIAISFSIIAQEFDYDVNGFVAGLGLGGLAFALAAKDALGNLFGGVVIITEKPFSIGDWIKTPSVEGTVEDITFRSTKVRTFDQALVTVPNATLANESITNWSKMGKRRITFHLGVTYDTPKDKLEKTIKRIKQLLINHPEIHQETIFVTFDRFSDNSLDIFLYFFTKTTVWERHLEVKEEINFSIMQILEEEGVTVAFPSRTLYIHANTESLTDTATSLGQGI